MNTVKCSLCEKVILVPEKQTRTDVLIKHLLEIKHNGDTDKK